MFYDQIVYYFLFYFQKTPTGLSNKAAEETLKTY